MGHLRSVSLQSLKTTRKTSYYPGQGLFAGQAVKSNSPFLRRMLMKSLQLTLLTVLLISKGSNHFKSYVK